MPSSRKVGWGRTANKWRVKDGNKVVFEHERRGACVEWMRKNKPQNGAFRLIPPNT